MHTKDALSQMDLRSKLPQLGTTIFTVMSQLAMQHQAVNLGQGFPDFEPDPRLLDAASRAMHQGMNQYAPMTGLPALRAVIEKKILHFGGVRYDADQEITVTAGATEALTSAILALVHPGDEVFVLEPVYDSYIPAIQLAGGNARAVSLNENYLPDWSAIAAAITPATRGIMINSPHNPTGRVWTLADMEQLQALCEEHGLWVISDEVYEHMVFDGQKHHSVSHFPRLAKRSVLVSSFGKSLHVTGWKIAYAAAPAALSAEFRKVHQYNVFSVATPLQAAIASYWGHDFDSAEQLPAFYQAKRDLFRQGLSQTGFTLMPCEGTYFQVVDYSGMGNPCSQMNDLEFCQWLTEHVGVAAIPVSSFYTQGSARKHIRFCFAKKDETLRLALGKLAAGTALPSRSVA